MRFLKRGDVIVFHHPHYGIMIKRIESISPGTGEIYVLGAHPNSVDSNRFGPIHLKDVVGQVLWHIKSNHK
jgi:hypothetical protein